MTDQQVRDELQASIGMSALLGVAEFEWVERSPDQSSFWMHQSQSVRKSTAVFKGFIRLKLSNNVHGWPGRHADNKIPYQCNQDAQQTPSPIDMEMISKCRAPASLSNSKNKRRIQQCSAASSESLMK